MPYDKYRQFTPNPEGGASSNATLFDNRQQKNSECQRGDTEAAALMIGSLYFILIKYQLSVKLAILELMCVCASVCVCVCVCECVCDAITSTVSLYSRINFKHLLSY